MDNPDTPTNAAEPVASARPAWMSLLIYIAAFFAIWYGLSKFIDFKVSDDAVSRFNMAMRNGDKSTACFQAGMAAAGFLNAKNENQYRIWRDKERNVCAGQ